MDKIHIRELLVRCSVGIFEWEKQTLQDVVISLSLHVDLSTAGRSDAIGDTVDYKQLKHRIMSHVETEQFALIERMAEEVADICLENPLVKQVDVLIDKLGALRFARSVAVEISRTRK